MLSSCSQMGSAVATFIKAINHVCSSRSPAHAVCAAQRQAAATAGRGAPGLHLLLLLPGRLKGLSHLRNLLALCPSQADCHYVTVCCRVLYHCHQPA